MIALIGINNKTLFSRLKKSSIPIALTFKPAKIQIIPAKITKFFSFHKTSYINDIVSPAIYYI